MGDTYRDAVEAGADIRPEMEPPEILDGFGGWYEDFWELSSERQIGMGVGPIPASAIDRHVAGWHYEDADMFRAVIRAMDGVYLEMANRRDDEPKADSEPTSARDAFRGAFGRGKRRA